MKALTIAFVTAREKPKFNWFFASLYRQRSSDMEIHVILIDLLKEWHAKNAYGPIDGTWVPPKPSVFQGPHRLTPVDVWDMSSARNTGLCLCKTEWIAFLDDRCVLQPGWLASIEDAMNGNYAVFGAYEKRHGMKVVNGEIADLGKLYGSDCREKYCLDNSILMPFQCPGEWSFGCNLAFPLEWGLEVNGWDESLCPSVGMEDVFLGMMMKSNGKDVRYDSRMKVIQDREPSELGKPIFRRDKGISPNDKSHEILKRLKDLKRAPNPWDIRDLRNHVLTGNPFPIPTTPTHDWFDQEPLSTYGL